jgi:Tfp pilus assembly protein PilV
LKYTKQQQQHTAQNQVAQHAYPDLQALTANIASWVALAQSTWHTNAIITVEVMCVPKDT